MSLISSFSKSSIFISEKSCNIGFSFSSIINNEYEVITNVNSVDDKMPLVKRSDNFELRGAIDKGIYPRVSTFKTERKKFVDGFD